MTFVRASSIVLAGLLVCSTSLAHLDPLIRRTGGRDADADRKRAVGAACSIMAKALAVQWVAFDAVVEDGAVVLSWETAAEIDNEGFNLLRGIAPRGEFEAVNDRLIPAAGGPAFGAVYEYVDTAVEVGTTYYYLLENVATSGAVTLRGIGACRYDFDASSPCEPLAVTLPTGPAVIFADGFELGSTSAWSSNG